MWSRTALSMKKKNILQLALKCNLANDPFVPAKSLYSRGMFLELPDSCNPGPEKKWLMLLFFFLFSPLDMMKKSQRMGVSEEEECGGGKKKKNQ